MICDAAVNDASIACLAGGVIRTVILGAHGHPPQQRGQRRTRRAAQTSARARPPRALLPLRAARALWGVGARAR